MLFIYPGVGTFLMHRVELKGMLMLNAFARKIISFLMHRVELKARGQGDRHPVGLHVPNAPCGVESRT